MKIERRRGRFRFGACEFQAASMADLAFLLLVFVVVTTTFAVEEGIPLLLPGRATTTRVDVSDVLEIRALAGGVVEAAGARIELRDVRPLIVQRLASNRELVVVLATHRHTEYGLMVDLLDEIKLSNCRRISLQTLE